jgi:hypothetical protein
MQLLLLVGDGVVVVEVQNQVVKILLAEIPKYYINL